MDQTWGRNNYSRQEDNNVDGWDSNSSDEESSIGDYEGTMMQVNEVDLEEDFCCEFPRDELSAILDGLNRFPWTVYPNHLRACLEAAAKIANAGREEFGTDLRRLQTLYREAVPNSFEKCLDDKAIWKWSEDIHNNIFEAICRLMDVIIVKLQQLTSAAEDFGHSEDDLLPLLRTLAMAFDKQCQFHVKHKEQGNIPPLQGIIPSIQALHQPSKFARPMPGTPNRQRHGDWYCSIRKGSVKEADGCDCSRCRPPDVYCWLSYLLNYFGNSGYGNGYHILLRVLCVPQRLLPAVMEALLLPVAKATEFMTDEVAAWFQEPCSKILRYVSDLLVKDVDALSDKTKDGSFGALSLILKHLQAIIGRGSSAEKAESMVSVVQRKMVERMLGFNSFNKQLSAVREINKLLENARAISTRDKSRSVNATILWLEKNDILRNVLRSHLHHKQYVDQVEKIMRFLLQERRLSEEHLDAIWAATEKPDQFETVKANIFDLLADLAWSFSAEQLDSLFGRFERSQGRSASDIVKILTLVKKLARSDTKGVMAQRLLELLWNMMHSGEAPAEVLDSGALTEILGHYDSVNCASKDEYITKCFKNVETGTSVIPSLRLLREIILLDNEKPFYAGEISRQLRLQKLIAENGLLLMVVRSLEDYMKLARSASTAKLLKAADFRHSHEQNVNERLAFLLFAIQSSGASLPWDATERLWCCLVESPILEADREWGLRWLCSTLEKSPCLSFEAMLNILTKKITCIDPIFLSETAWRCFMKLFVWVNLNENKLVKNGPETTVTQDLDLIGMPYMWNVALSSPVDTIAEQSINLLRDIHTCLADNLQGKLVEIRQSFTNECLRHLSAALDTEDVKHASETSDSNSMASCSMMETGEAAEVESVGNDMEKPADKGPYKVERCLRLLREYIIKCEGRCPRNILAHGASFQGRPMILGVSTANKQSTRFELRVHSNEYLGCLRSKVAERLDCPVSRVRLMHLNKELLQDSQVLRQFGLADGHSITASVNIVDRLVEEMDENQLPGILISQHPEVYDNLFKLADANSKTVREVANDLLSLLPTHPGILNEFQTLHKHHPSKAKELLSLQFGAHSRLLYTLQVVDGLLLPVNRVITPETKRFRVDFVRFGGFQHLMTVFEPGALLGVDNQTRRGCYTSALRILKLVLSETQTTDYNGTCVLGAEPSIGESEDESTVCNEKEPNEGEVIDMEKVVGSLKRLAWAASLGRISMLGNSIPLSQIFKADKGYAAHGTVLDQDDRHLCLEALELLVACLQSHRSLLGTFFLSPDAGRFIVDMVLHSPDESVRFQAAARLLELSKLPNEHGKSAAAHHHIMVALVDAKAEANKEPKRCWHFMELLGKLFYSIGGPEDDALGEQQLTEELNWLSSAPDTVDDDDRLLEGHLFLVKVLMEVLDKRIVASSKGTGLAKELVERFLFQESFLLWKLDRDCNDKVFLEDWKMLRSKCGTRRSREKAFQLLTCLATHCFENLKEIVDLLLKIHFSADIQEWEHLPSYGRKALSGYVGLKNAGATCYMNSVFQQLYMQPEVRRTVLECRECDDREKADSVFFQLQAMFGALLGSSLDHYTPQGFWNAYRDYDGMPINLREHQDAFEFFNRLYDAVDETLKAAHQKTTLTRIFGGVFVQQVISRGCTHRSERDEPFAAISVDVKNKRDLLESLESFVRGDLLEADNAYHCEECGTKVDALKRVCVKSLPESLIIHLKRFDFDYESMQRLKLKDRFEFPMHLDMKPYTVEGLALRDSQVTSSSGGGCTDGSTTEDTCIENGNMDTTMTKPDSYYHYDLVGVVVHSGTAFAGHYYSYIKERGCNRWIAFDDKRVLPYDLNDLEKDCFGGKYTIDVYDNFLKTMSPQEFDRPNSAYMLLYERSCNEAASSLVDSPVSTAKGEDDGGQLMREVSTPRGIRRLRMPESIHRSVWKENLRFVHENHLLDKDYFKFILNLVGANLDVVDGREVRHSDSSSRERRGETSGRRPEESGVQELNPNDFAEISITLAVEFLFRVYHRTHGSLREDFTQWKDTVCKLISNLMACRCFLMMLTTAKRHWMRDYLLRCPIDDVRQAFGGLLVHALRTAVQCFRGHFMYIDPATGTQQDALFVEGTIELLVMLLADVSCQKSYLQQILQVFFEYAKLAPSTRAHLVRKSVVGHLVTVATKLPHLLKQDAIYIHSIISVLVRSCDTSKLYDEPPDVEKKGSEKQKLVANPFQYPPPAAPITKDILEYIFRNRGYTSFLVKNYPEQEEVMKLLEFCSWRNEAYSGVVLHEIMDELHAPVNSEFFKAILALAARIFDIGDHLHDWRQEVIMLGYDNFPHNGVMDLLVSKGLTPKNRYLLIKFVVGVVGNSPAVRQHVLSRRHDWRLATEWLQREIHEPSALMSSNEDITSSIGGSNYLARTSTAEWTLAAARDLVGDG